MSHHKHFFLQCCSYWMDLLSGRDRLRSALLLGPLGIDGAEPRLGVSSLHSIGQR